MYLDGESISDIMRETGIRSKDKIYRILDKHGIPRRKGSLKETEAGGGVDAGVRGQIVYEGSAGLPEAGEEEVREGAERTVVALATPVIKKVVLNPKILLFYDYLRSKGYEGDLGDFIVDCIETLFRRMGYQIVVERRSEVE